jgi:thiol-disulfide isomerase/thioredoxin
MGLHFRFSTLVLVFLLLAVAFGKDDRAELSLKDLNGKRVRLSDYRKNSVVLNFWATWCGPCKEEMPRLVEAEKQYGDRGIVFVAASLDDKKGRDKILDFIRQHQISFPIWLGATVDDLKKLEMGEGLPATAFVDEDGHIVARVLGEIRSDEIKERLDWLTQGRSGAAPQAIVNHMGDK